MLSRYDEINIDFQNECIYIDCSVIEKIKPIKLSILK